MSKEDQANSQSTKGPESDPGVQAPEVVRSIETAKPATEEQLQKAENKINTFERSTLRWTRATFGIMAITALFIGFQWYEMRSGGADTHALALAAGKQADKAETISESLQKAVTEMKTSNINAGMALDASIAASRLDQRAWVGTAESAIRFGENGSLSLDVFFANTGKTPATEVNSSVQFAVFPANRPAVPPEDSTYNFTPQGPFPPQAKHTYNITAQLPGDVYQEVLTGQRHIVFFGRILYSDTFSKGTHHRTDWCLTYTPSTKALRVCIKGNAMD